MGQNKKVVSTTPEHSSFLGKWLIAAQHLKLLWMVLPEGKICGGPFTVKNAEHIKGRQVL